MATKKANKRATKTARGAGSELGGAPGSAAPPRFYWKQCYGMGGERYHWALCDTQTDAESGHAKVSCCYMVLLADYPECCDGKPLSEQHLPKLIAELLTKHFSTRPQNEKVSGVCRERGNL